MLVLHFLSRFRPVENFLETDSTHDRDRSFASRETSYDATRRKLDIREAVEPVYVYART